MLLEFSVVAGILSISATIASIGVMFFAGDAIAGEFGRRTGYILFPTPVRRTTMVIGKYLACFVAVALMLQQSSTLTIVMNMHDNYS